MKTLTWPTTERRRRRRRQNSMPWLITLIFLIRPSIIQSQGMAMPGPLPPNPLPQEVSGHATMYESDCDYECECEYSSEHWIFAPKCWVNYEALFDFWFRFRFRFRRFTSSGHWATLASRTVCRTSKSNYPYKYWTLSAIVDETLWLVSIWFMRSCRKREKSQKKVCDCVGWVDCAIPFLAVQLVLRSAYYYIPICSRNKYIII